MTRRALTRSRLGFSLVALVALACVAISAAAFASPSHDAARGKQAHHNHHHHRSAKAKTPSSFFGVVPQDHLTPTDYETMGDNGAKILRIGLYWTAIEPTEDGGYDFSDFDDTVRQAAENGLTVLPDLYGTPEWVAKGLDDHDGCASQCHLYAPTSPAALAAWKNFNSAAAARYGRNGTFWSEQANAGVPKKPIKTWQIWNEQNSKTFYLPKPNPKPYAKLLASSAKGIRAEDSKADIVLGGMFGLPGKNDTSRSIAAADFLHKLLKIKGAKQNFDGFALHPYSKGLDFVKKQVTVARAEMRKSGYPGAELWITETGAASGGEPSGLNLGSQKAQAQRVTDTYKLFERNRKAWNVKLVAWFAWQDVTEDKSNCFFCPKAGLVTTSGKAKLSLKAYKRAAK